MTSPRLFDAPLEDPDEDLLETAPYARKLADFILSVQPPFTIGVYGEWGSGKTSFVHFVQSYLEQSSRASSILFLRFSAWPYKTAEELWRALILAIARRLYEVPDTTEPTPQVHESFRKRFVRLLTGDALVVDDVPPAPGPLDGYHDLVARLDQTPGNLGSRGERQLRVDHEEALAALARAAFSSLSAFSPLVSGIRSFLGLDSGIDPGQVVRREANQALRERVESVGELRKTLRKLFEDKAKDRCVCIFVDDLDRTMPDVALDLLEAAKIFLGEVRCIFLIAADENLIGQGLRLRFRDILESDPGQETRDLFLRKGQEYFEKIIQLGIRVPPRSAEQTQRFIAAQFPHWLPATDILRASIGDNPRRLKQYCNLLDYKYLVAEPDLPAEDDLAPLLAKIVALQAWRPESLELLRKAACEPGTYRESLKRIESCLKDSKVDKPVEDVESRLPGAGEKALFAGAIQSEPLLRLFREPPLFSQQDPGKVATLARFADAGPHRNTILRSRDACFLRVLEVAARRIPSSPERFLLEGLTRLCEIHRLDPVLLSLLEAAVHSEEWTEGMENLETRFEKSQFQLNEGEKLPERFQAIFDHVRAAGPAVPEQNVPMRLLLGRPRMTALLVEEILGFAEIRPRLPTPESLLSRELTFDSSDLQRDRILAQWALRKLNTDFRGAAEEGLRLRSVAARYFLDLRTFAKIDAFSHCWPDRAQKLQVDSSALIRLEAEALQPEARESTGTGRDERLLSFLQLRPLFRDIDPLVLRKYLKVSEVTEPQSLIVAEKPTISAAPAVAMTAAAAVETVDVLSTPAEEDLPPYQNVFLHLLRKVESGVWELSLRMEGLPELRFGTSLSAESIAQVNRRLAGFDESSSRPLLREPQIHQRFSDLAQEIGEDLFRSLLQGAAHERLDALLRQPQRLRFLWDISGVEAMGFPIESLYLPSPIHLFPALTQRYSVVRHLSSPLPTIQSGRWAPPLRILAMFPLPSDVAPLNVDGELQIFRRSLAAAEESGAVQVEVLPAGGSTYAALAQALRTFRPHVFHFVGHGSAHSDEREAAIILESDQSDRSDQSDQAHAFLVRASDFAKTLYDSSVRLAILNACDTGMSPRNDAISSLAGALISGGLAAVVGTLRQVSDNAALMFTREFYRSLTAGYSVEAAVIDARKALNVEGWDWSVYALFTRLQDPSSLRLVYPPSRQK